jgi:predicted GTPase
MGIVTISRISHIIIAVFDLSRDLEPQFLFYDRVKFLPKTIYIALNKSDLVKNLNDRVEEYTKKIKEYFIEKRKINIVGISAIVAKALPDFEDYNEKCVDIIVSCLQSDR